MTSRIPQIHWEDGLLLRPQHLQAFQQHCQGLISQLALSRSFGYGVRHLEIRGESIGNWVVEVPSCEIVMHDGSVVVAGETAVVAPVEFRHLELDAPVLDVWLAIPFLQASAANIHCVSTAEAESLQVLGSGAGDGCRFYGIRIPFQDENTGANAQEIGVKLLNGRIFVGQRPPDGHATLKLAELRKVVSEGEEGRRYELSPTYVPACLTIDASPALHAVLTDVLHKVEEKNEELLGHLKGRRDLLTGDAMDRPDTLLKLQATNSILPVLRQLAGQPEMHPFDVYLNLCRLVGDLAIFSEDWRPPKLALYDHENPLSAFHDFRTVALELLEQAVDTTVERRAFAATQDDPRVWEVEVPAAFTAPGVQLMLGIETSSSVQEVGPLFSEGRTVLAGPDDILDVLRARIDAVPCHQDDDLHPSLRDRSGMVFLRLHPEGRFWDAVVQQGRMALAGEAADGDTRFFLYAAGIRRKGEG